MFEKWIRIASIQALDVLGASTRNVWMVVAQVFSTSLSLPTIEVQQASSNVIYGALTYVVEPCRSDGKKIRFLLFPRRNGNISKMKKKEKENKQRELK